MKVIEKIKELGNCIELVSIDPHFHEVSTGLFRKGNILTIWSYSKTQGIEKRIEQIRDRCCRLGDLSPIPNRHDQMRLATSINLDLPLRFMFSSAVEKPPDGLIPTGEITSPDTKTKLIFKISGEKMAQEIVYAVSVEGVHERSEMRIRAVVGGFIKYGGCERVAPNKFKFTDGGEYNKFVRLLLPYARNISAVEDMLTQADMEGQMTTQTLGFSQT
jgi:hypothetical protein|tara:strand:+ start:372 stop:1022 length:651 start_codon:yes stop_codon:yes gene_type:complete